MKQTNEQCLADTIWLELFFRNEVHPPFLNVMAKQRLWPCSHSRRI